MEAPFSVAIPPNKENSNLEHKVDEVARNVDNLSKQQVQVEQVERQTEEMEREEKEDHGQRSVELQTGFRILKDLMADSNKNVNWPFMDPIEVSAPDLVDDYYEKIERPIWLKLMKDKFMKQKYTSITEFVSDFRLMLENCYRYNGPDHYVSKRGQKLETMLEQKLALLSRELRAKTSIAATSGHGEEGSSSSSLGLRRRQKTLPRHDSTLLLNQLREQELQRERDYRRQIILDRKAEKEALALEVLDWEDKILFQGKYKEQMEAMWELPQIGLFLFLCQSPLNVGEIMQLELERCIMVPRESSTMQLIMTSLLSTPFQRQKIDKKTLMPYNVWNEKLSVKLQQWYKVYADSGMDAEKACVKLGFEPEFFTVVGQKNPMERKRFHEISFYRRVWIVKGLCDYCMQTQDCLRETVEIQPFQDQREYMLGTDGDGWRYLHFPQFCGADVRIYKQAPIKYPKIEIIPDPFDSKRKFPLKYKPPPTKKLKMVKKKKKVKKKRTPPVSPIPSRLRPAGLRQTPKTVIPLQLFDSSTSTSTSSASDDDDEVQDEAVDTGADTNDDTNEATDVNEEQEEEKDESETDPAISDDDNDEKKSADGQSTGSDATIPYCDNSCSDSVNSSRSCSRASSPCFTQDSVSQDTRFDSSRENSASPMIDRHVLRKFRKGTRLKDFPNSRAARNLNSFLFMEDSNSRSSDCGDNSNSGMPVFKVLLEQNENSSSSGIGDNTNSCDMKDLFKNSALDAENSNSAINEAKPGDDSRLVEDMDTSVNDETYIPNGDTRNNCLTAEQTSSESEHVSNFEKNKLLSEEDKETNVTPDRLTEVESKENEVTCNGSHEPVLFKNSNGYINRSESMILDRHKISENVSDEHENKNVKVENAPGEVSRVDTDKDNDLKSEELSDAEIEQNDNESDMETDERREMPETRLESNEANIMSKLENNNTADLENTGEDSGKENNVMTDDSYFEKQNKIEEAKLDDSKIASTASQLDSVSDTDVNTTIKQEPKEVDEINCKSDIDLESIKHENYSKKKELKDIQYEDGKESIDTSKVKNEISDSTSEMNNINIAQDSANMEGLKETVDEKGVDISKAKAEIKEEIIKDEIKEETVAEEEEEEEVKPDMESFKLIVDSVEGLRKLTDQFAEQEPIVIKRGKKEQVTKPPPRKRCVVLLFNRLSYLLKELEPWESKLTQATKRARIKLRKEVEDFVEKEEEEPGNWDTDEETESGSEGSDNETEAEKRSKTTSSPVKLLKGRNSECSTPVRFEDSSEEIDISQRGRLRKRRIIPNNAEDQNPVKKSKVVVKSETSSQPQNFVQKQGDSSGQAGKIMIGYSELIRQLKAVSPSGIQGTNSPILLQTSQGGKVLVTSIVPTGAKANPNIQNLMFVNQSSASSTQQASIAMATTVSSMKQTQHPTIQHLLAKPQTTESSSQKIVSATIPTTSGLRHILPQTTSVIQGATPSVIIRQTTAANQQRTPVKTPIILKPNTSITPQKVVLSYPVTPQKAQTTNQTNKVSVIPQQIVTPPLSVAMTTSKTSVSPQLVSTPQQPVSMGTSSKGKMKYYAANASTLPINVVQQLLATRGAKLQTGPNQQSILFIPMESEGNTRSVISVSKAVAENTVSSAVLQTGSNTVVTQSATSPVVVSTPGVTVSQTIRSQSVKNSVKVVTSCATQAVSDVQESAIAADSCASLSSSVTIAGTTLSVSHVSTSSESSVNTGPVSSVYATVVPVLSKISNPSVSLTTPVTQNLHVQTGAVVSGASGSYLKPTETTEAILGAIKCASYTPPKYPTNETVRTLLFKRKSSAEEKDKISLPSPESSVEKSSNNLTSVHGIHFQKISPKPPNPPAVTVANPVALQQIQVPFQQISPNQNIILAKTTANQVLAPGLTVANQNAVLNIQNAQQCVFTSISASKLNTLLLQTSAAGAKSIPSLIKLPSKAALDSAVKAVVTSVNVTLPTVNIKVPSPTSLPSIGPRRNVTKTIQTMKSPIPVAPKVVTQSSGLSMSMASSNMSSASLPLVSVPGHTVGLSTSLANLIPAHQIQSSSLPVVTLAGQSAGLSSNLLQAVRAQLGSTATISVTGVTGHPQTAQSNAAQAAIVSVAGQGTHLGQSGQSLSTIVQNIDGKNVLAKLIPQAIDKNVLTKMIPQTILTSQGLVQGFITPQGIVIPQAKKPQGQAGTQSATLSQTGLQKIVKQEPFTSLATQPIISAQQKVLNMNSSTLSVSMPNLTPAPLQYIKALNATNQTATNVIQLAGQPNTTQVTLTTPEVLPRKNVATNMPVSQLKSPSLPTGSGISSATPGSASIHSLQQAGKFIFPPNLQGLTVSASTSASVSPVLNVPSGLLVPGSGGMQVASPVLNHLGFPLLQSGMAVQSPGVLPQNLNLLQNSVNPAALQQLVNPVLLTPGMISPQLLNQSQGLQLASQNSQGVKTEPLQQNNLMQLPGNVGASLQKVQASGSEKTNTLNLQTGQVHALGNQTAKDANASNVNGDALKQVNAAALVKQLAASQLQNKISMGNASVPDVKPVLLQQQLNTPANQSAGVKLATNSMMQNLAIAKPMAQLQSQVKLEGGKIVAGSSSALPQTNLQETKPLAQAQHAPVVNIAATKVQTSGSVGPKIGSKTIAVNQITNEVVTPVCANPTSGKQTPQVPSRVIAVNKKSNKLEDVFPQEVVPSISSPSLGRPPLNQIQSKPVVIRPLKSPETVQNAVTGSQQKIMLFSIGGQLVTQQGVPVTLENGVLKLMPQAIVQIANQTLTPKQIQQTLAKISQATLPPGSLISHPQSETDLAVPVTVTTRVLASTHESSTVRSEAFNRDHTYETPTKVDVKGPKQSLDNAPQSTERKERSPDERQENRFITVPNITSTAGGSMSNMAMVKSGSGNVQFVLKPMVYSSGYIVCPRMSGIASHAENKVGNDTTTGANVVNSENETAVSVVSDANLLLKTGTGVNLNGDRESHIDHDEEEDDDDLSETPLVIDTEGNDTNKNQDNYVHRESASAANANHGSYMDKEAALNLLRLANQALGSSDEVEEKDIDNAGDANNKLGSTVTRTVFAGSPLSCTAVWTEAQSWGQSQQKPNVTDSLGKKRKFAD